MAGFICVVGRLTESVSENVLQRELKKPRIASRLDFPKLGLLIAVTGCPGFT